MQHEPSLSSSLASLKPAIHHPKSNQEQKWAEVDISCGVGDLVNSPVSLFCLIPSLHFPPCLAPALLMIPRQEAGLA